MLRYKIDYDSCRKKEFKEKLRNYYVKAEDLGEKHFFTKPLDKEEINQVFNIIKVVEENYYSALEYFSSFLVMRTGNVLHVIQDRRQTRIWDFISNAVFDEGVNNLWSFYDGSDDQPTYTFLFKRFYDITGEKLSEFNFKDPLINELCLYRHHASAHMGRMISDENKARIHFSTPYRVIERARGDLCDFWSEALNIENFNSGDINNGVHNKTIGICEILGITDKLAEIEKEANKSLEGLLKDD